MKINLSIFNFNMKKFIFKISQSLLFFFLFLVSVNYWGDSAKIFQTGYENKIADIIFNNKNATNISNFDERILQRELINNLEIRPDIMVLGSSRTMLINSTYFKGSKFINNSVSGASFEDLISIFQIYKTKKILPKKIILGIDPWIFNRNNGQESWKSLRNEYYSFTNKKTIKKESIINNKFKQLFSLSYFQSSFRNLPNVIIGTNDPIATDKINNESNTKLVDGSLSYNKIYRESLNTNVEILVRSNVSKDIYSIENFNIISPKIFDEFEDLCKNILDNNIELSFFISPYHPIFYEKIKQDYPMVLLTEKIILKFAKENNIKCFGSFNPMTEELESQDFYDGMHDRESTIKKILKIKTHNTKYNALAKW
jgi:hypothetical protein